MPWHAWHLYCFSPPWILLCSITPIHARWPCKSFTTNSTFKPFLSWMHSPVFCQTSPTSKTFAAFCVLVFISVNIHMLIHASQTQKKTFLTFTAWWKPIFEYCLYAVDCVPRTAWNRIWAFRCRDSLNASPHTGHSYGLSAAWTPRWRFRVWLRVNGLSHT